MESETIHINDSWRSSYAAHDHDPNCADIYADLQSMYLLCKSMHMAGLAQSTSANSLTQATRDLCPSLEIIRGPAERSRIMRQQLKAQEDMSLGNLHRSVHRLRSNKEQKTRKISCMVLNAFWVHLSMKCCLLSSDLAHLCSTFENSTFLVSS
jgi:hypothetical protein